MISPLYDRQGFDTGLSGVEGSAIESAYVQPVVEPEYFGENASVMYPLGDPWGWDIYPWNWGKEGDAEKEDPTPDTPSESQPWKATGDPVTMLTGGFMLVIVALSAWFLVKYIPGGYK